MSLPKGKLKNNILPKSINLALLRLPKYRNRILYGCLLVIATIFLGTIIQQSKSIRNGYKDSKGKLADQSRLKLSLPTPALLPVSRNGSKIELTSKAIYAIDYDSMVTLFEQNSETRVPLASTTKIMTALVAMEHYSLDDVLTVDDTVTDGSNAGLLPQERYRVDDLLGALLVGSANDAAEVLASNFPGGINSFVWAMNHKAAEIKMTNTNFTNPIGYDHPDHYSSAKDLAILSVNALHQPLFASLVAKKDFTFFGETQKQTLRVKNTNDLLEQDASVLGIKTGWTEEAGECLVAYAQRNNHPIITVVLGSDSRFSETENLINWIYDNYNWQEIIAQSTRQ